MNRLHRAGFGALALLAVSVTACSSSSDSPAGTTDGGGTDTAVGTDSGGESCVAATNVASIVNKDHDPGPPPAMTGGTVVDGTYVLTKMVQYNGENGNTPHKETFVFAGGNAQDVQSDGTSADKATFLSYTTSGNQITITLRCGATGTLSSTFTATATSFTMVNPDDKNEIHTWTKK